MRESFQSKIFICLCLLALGAISFIALSSRSQTLEKKLSFELEANAVSQAIFEAFSDPRSCTRAVKTIFARPPDLSSPLLLTHVYRSSDQRSDVLIKRGDEVARIVRIQKIALRRFDSGKDSSPGPKIEIELEAIDESLSGMRVTRTHDLFTSTKASGMDPKYDFQCATLPLTSVSSKLTLAQVKDLACSPSSVTTVSCPQGMKAISCSMRVDLLRVFDDQFHCQVKMEAGECTFTHSQTGPTCESIDGNCNCL